MANADEMLSTADLSDTSSPTTAILNALKAAKVPLNAGNIRRYVEQMRLNGGGTLDAQDNTVRFQGKDDSGPSVGQRGNVSKKVESTASPSSASPSSAPQERGGSEPRGQTSALSNAGLSPDYYLGATGDESPSGLAALILGGSGAAGAGAYGLSKLRNWGLGSGAGPMPDPGAGVHTSAVPRPGEPGGNPGEMDYTQIDPGRGSAMVEPPPSPMQQAMQRAIEPATGLPSVGDSVPPMPDIGPVPQPRIPAGPGSAVLPPDVGSPPPQTIPSGPNTQVRPQNMPENAPNMPFRGPRTNAVPMSELTNPSFYNLGKQVLRLFGGAGR